MQDWRKPSVVFKNRLKAVALSVLVAAGRLRHRDGKLGQTRREGVFEYFGDVPDDGDGLKPRSQQRLLFTDPPPRETVEHDLLYSPTGMAWLSGTLHEAYSARYPSLKEALARPPRNPLRSVEEGVIVESDYLYSYGDWLHTYLGTILLAHPLAHSLILPHFLAQKSYVRTELDLLGVRYLDADGWIHVRKAHVLRKQMPLFYWTREYVEAFQRAFAPDRQQPVPGSITYLGRYDLPTEAVARRYPSDEAAAAVRALGGDVIRQEILSAKTARNLGGGMETIVADHGSGVLNMMFWRPRTVIELVVDNWWVNNNLVVAKEMGVENYAVIGVDGLSSGGIAAKLQRCFDYFRAR